MLSWRWLNDRGTIASSSRFPPPKIMQNDSWVINRLKPMGHITRQLEPLGNIVIAAGGLSGKETRFGPPYPGYPAM